MCDTHAHLRNYYKNHVSRSSEITIGINETLESGIDFFIFTLVKFSAFLYILQVPYFVHRERWNLNQVSNNQAKIPT